jgi:cytochrome c-type biogenesis protein CcmH
MKLRSTYLFLLLMAAFLGSVLEANAQGGGPSADEVNAIAKNLYCPVCESVPLDVCGTLACEQWRQQIADKLSDGYTDQEIYDFFVEQYGDRVLATPPARGLNWLIYVVPPLAIVIGGWVYFRTVSDGRDRAEAIADKHQPKPNDKDPYIDELERELDERR